MAKKKGNVNSWQDSSESLKPKAEPTKMHNPVIPTGDRRHVAAVREGRQSSEIYCRNAERRKELGLPPLPDPDSFFIEEIRA
jgi:hypothetical protein